MLLDHVSEFLQGRTEEFWAFVSLIPALVPVAFLPTPGPTFAGAPFILVPSALAELATVAVEAVREVCADAVDLAARRLASVAPRRGFARGTKRREFALIHRRFQVPFNAHAAEHVRTRC